VTATITKAAIMTGQEAIAKSI